MERPMHPGEKLNQWIIATSKLERSTVSIESVAQYLKVPKTQLLMFLTGKIGCGYELSLRLQDLTKTESDVWQKMDYDYDYWYVHANKLEPIDIDTDYE